MEFAGASSLDGASHTAAAGRGCRMTSSRRHRPPGEFEREVEREIQLLMTDDAVVGERLDEQFNEETATPPPAAKAALFYLVKYVTKDSLELHDALSVLCDAQRARNSFLQDQRQRVRDPARAEQCPHRRAGPGAAASEARRSRRGVERSRTR